MTEYPTDWIDSFVGYTDGSPSPEIFRLWSGITAVSGALERRVWARTAKSILYPNLYTMLVGPPGTGKSQAILPVWEIWNEVKRLRVAPDNVTKAALIDCLAQSKRQIPSGAQMLEYHSLVVACAELGVLLPGNDLEFLSVLNQIYDNPPSYKEERRTTSRKIEIQSPQLIMLTGTQPGFLNEILPEVAWSQGFTSRQIMIYSSECPYVDLFSESSGPDTDHKKLLLSRLGAMLKLIGPVSWSDEAKELIVSWHKSHLQPVPQHSKLVYYNQRRILHLIKLSIISAVSRTVALQIDKVDVLRARSWMLSAEAVMPDIFRAMKARSDREIIMELHRMMYGLYSEGRAKGRSIPEAALYDFLSQYLPSERIKYVIDSALRSNIISREAGTGSDSNSARYFPRPTNLHGVE